MSLLKYIALESMSKEQYINHIVSKLEELQTWSDELPEEMIYSDAKNNKYKCRNGWFSATSMYINNLISKKIISPEIAKEYNQIWNNQFENCPTRKDRTTSKSIKDASNLINKTIEYLLCQK